MEKETNGSEGGKEKGRRKEQVCCPSLSVLVLVLLLGLSLTANLVFISFNVSFQS